VCVCVCVCVCVQARVGDSAWLTAVVALRHEAGSMTTS
jgi:hypothetical protein